MTCLLCKFFYSHLCKDLLRQTMVDTGLEIVFSLLLARIHASSVSTLGAGPNVLNTFAHKLRMALCYGLCYGESLWNLALHLTSRKDPPPILGGRPEIECLRVEGFKETNRDSPLLVESFSHQASFAAPNALFILCW